MQLGLQDKETHWPLFPSNWSCYCCCCPGSIHSSCCPCNQAGRRQLHGSAGCRLCMYILPMLPKFIGPSAGHSCPVRRSTWLLPAAQCKTWLLSTVQAAQFSTPDGPRLEGPWRGCSLSHRDCKRTQRSSRKHRSRRSEPGASKRSTVAVITVLSVPAVDANCHCATALCTTAHTGSAPIAPLPLSPPGSRRTRCVEHWALPPAHPQRCHPISRAP